MKNFASTLILCLLFLTACANTNQVPKSLSSTYDGTWDGYAQIPERRLYIRAEIKKGIVAGFIEDSANEKQTGFYEDRQVTGYIDSDNNMIIKPFSLWYPHPYFKNYGSPPKVIIETNFMSPERIEGTLHVDQIEKAPKYDWYLVKPATGKSDLSAVNSDITNSNVNVDEKEPWTGKFKLESKGLCSGIWAMKQEGQIVKSTGDSSDDFKGKVQGNQLKGDLMGASRTHYPFTIEMSSDYMSFTGTLDLIAHGLPCQLNERRIE